MLCEATCTLHGSKCACKATWLLVFACTVPVTFRLLLELAKSPNHRPHCLCWLVTLFDSSLSGACPGVLQVERNLASGAKNLFMPHELVAEQVIWLVQLTTRRLFGVGCLLVSAVQLSVAFFGVPEHSIPFTPCCCCLLCCYTCCVTC